MDRIPQTIQHDPIPPEVCQRCRVIIETDRLSRRTGWGLASVWDLINKHRYAAARQRLDNARACHEQVVA